MNHFGQIGNTFQESLAPANAGFRPRSGGTVVTHKEDINTQNVCTKFVHNIIRIHDITARLTHLFAVRSEDQSLRRPLRIRLLGGNDTDIVEEAVPES